LNIDLIEDSRLIIHTTTELDIFDLSQQYSCVDYGMSSIIDFDASKNGVNGFVGMKQASTTISKIVIQNESLMQNIFDLDIGVIAQKIALSTLGKYVAVISTDLAINVWDIASKEVVYTNNVAEIAKIKFIDDRQLLVQMPSNYLIVNVEAKINLKMMGSSLATAYDMEVSQDGSMIAVFTTDVVNIYTNTLVSVDNFTVPIKTEQIISISFTPNSNLVVVTNSNNAYVLSSAPCPDNYV
jgi:WD40 repeat protein